MPSDPPLKGLKVVELTGLVPVPLVGYTSWFSSTHHVDSSLQTLARRLYASTVKLKPLAHLSFSRIVNLRLSSTWNPLVPKQFLSLSLKSRISCSTPSAQVSLRNLRYHQNFYKKRIHVWLSRDWQDIDGQVLCQRWWGMISIIWQLRGFFLFWGERENALMLQLIC